MNIVNEARFCLFDQSKTFDVYVFIGVDKNVADRGVFKKWLQRAEAGQLIEDLIDDMFTFILVEEGFFIAQVILYNIFNFSSDLTRL